MEIRVFEVRMQSACKSGPMDEELRNSSPVGGMR